MCETGFCKTEVCATIWVDIWYIGKVCFDHNFFYTPDLGLIRPPKDSPEFILSVSGHKIFSDFDYRKLYKKYKIFGKSILNTQIF